MKESGEVTREELMLFTALWEKRSLTAAAEQLGIHLPKASRLLKSLRESFSDDLFIRIGNTMEPTRKASALLPRVAASLASLERLFAEYVTESQAQYVETADIKAVLDSLKQRNIWIGLATADTVPSAKNCLKRLEVLEKFDYVGADDGVLRPKPEADMFLEFQKKFGLKPQEIAVVGDTYNDIRFARENGGVAIGVLSGVSQEADFCGEADYILNSVGELPQLLEQI